MKLSLSSLLICGASASTAGNPSSSLDTEFANWKAQYGLQGLDSAAVRENFAANDDLIKILNHEDEYAEYGHNRFSGKSEDEIRSFMMAVPIEAGRHGIR